MSDGTYGRFETITTSVHYAIMLKMLGATYQQWKLADVHGASSTLTVERCWISPMIKPNFILSVKSLSVPHEWMNYDDGFYQSEKSIRHMREWREKKASNNYHSTHYSLLLMRKEGETYFFFHIPFNDKFKNNQQKNTHTHRTHLKMHHHYNLLCIAPNVTSCSWATTFQT